MKNRTKWFIPLLAVFGLLTWEARQASADIIENFDNPTGLNGQVLFHADPVYVATGTPLGGGDRNGNPGRNALILKENNFPPFSTGGWGVISHDQSGSGYFLYEGTNSPGNPIGVYVGTFWASENPVPVIPHTRYRFSFYLTNSTPRLTSAGQNPAIVQALINGTPLGPTVSAAGYFSDGIQGHGWQRFVFIWHSGLSTTAVLSLKNLQANGNGGGTDFGVDTLELTALPHTPINDFDGLGKSELAVFRPSTAQWFAGGPTSNRLIGTFGATNLADIPVPADYDDVGYSELAYVWGGET
jgi:hypothetical protein